MRQTLVFSIALFLCTACAINGWAQENRATLRGRITDSTGAVVMGAMVTVVSEDTGVWQQTQANGQGEWTLPLLNPGRYTVTITFSGFKTAERTNITLDTADDKQLDISLKVGAMSQRVVVSGATDLIDTTSATSGTVITPEVMADSLSCS